MTRKEKCDSPTRKESKKRENNKKEGFEEIITLGTYIGKQENRSMQRERRNQEQGK